jgi:hypothetical protein
MSYNVKRETVEISIVIIASIIAVLVMIFIFPRQQGRYYDCGMAEWHPDIPNKVKEECRKIRTENFKENLQKPK